MKFKILLDLTYSDDVQTNIQMYARKAKQQQKNKKTQLQVQKKSGINPVYLEQEFNDATEFLYSVHVTLLDNGWM